MAEGILAEVEDGFARLQFIDKSKAGPALRALLALVGPELIDVDTRSGRRKVYIVPESVAQDAGLLDDAPAEPEPVVPEPGVPDPVDAPEPTSAPDESWTVAQLREFAAREEISLAGADKKADILAAIQAATRPAGAPADE